MVQNYYLLVPLIALVLVLASLYLTISYQHMRIRESIIARAEKMGCPDVKKLEDALDDMMGPALRAFGSATDAEFKKQLDEIFAD